MAQQPRSELAAARIRAGYSQEALAEQIGVSRTAVAGWERGSQGIYPRNRRPLAEALGVSVEQVARLIKAARDDTQGGAKVDRPDRSASGRAVDVFLHEETAWPVGGSDEALPEQWDRNVAHAFMQATQTQSGDDSSLDEAEIQAFHGLVHQWLITPPPQMVELSAGRRVGMGLVGRIERRLVQLRHLDDFVGGRDSQLLVERELGASCQILQDGSYNDAVGRRLLRAIGELCWLAGWVAADAGQHRRALGRYSCGIQAAQAAGDRLGAANLISTAAYHLANHGQAEHGLVAARSAVAGVDSSDSASARALLNERLAWASAKNGDLARTEATLDTVDLLYDERLPEEDPEWVYWLDRDEIDVMAGRCYIEVGRPAQAIELLCDVLDRYDTNRRREHALYNSWLSEAHLAVGNLDEAARTALETLQTTIGSSSSRTEDRVQVLLDKLTPFEKSESVGEFVSAGRELLA